MSEKVLCRCPYCDFVVTQARAETWAEGYTWKHLLKSHKKEALELVRKAREEAAKADEQAA